MSSPALPLITLRHGPWRAEVFDPRGDPLALGARYVHGGYLAALWHGERLLTGQPLPGWSAFHGRGLPETFELSLGACTAGPGQEVLRLGAGRVRLADRNPREGELARLPLSTGLEWRLAAQDGRGLAMEVEDDDLDLDWQYGYHLRRELVLEDDGLVSRSTLTLRCRRAWQAAVSWFAHPFLAHTAADRTAFDCGPGRPVDPTPHPVHGAPPQAVERGADGLWRLRHGTRSVLGGLWGSRQPLVVHLDPALGGGRLALELDAPLDHAVLWASRQVASLEPKLARWWPDGETATWTLRYRFLGA